MHAPVVLFNEIMGQSARDSATRAFVSVLLLLARSYELVLAINRDSSEPELFRAYRELIQTKAAMGCFGTLVGSSRGEVLEEALRGASLLCKIVSGTRFHTNFTQKSHMIFLGGRL